MTIQLADRSFKLPRGVADDVIVKVGKFVFPVDFVIMDIEEDEHVPLFLGRPFLNTTKVVINVNDQTLKLRVGTEEITFNVAKIMKQPLDAKNCLEFLDSIQELVEEHLEEILTVSCEDPTHCTPCLAKDIYEVFSATYGEPNLRLSDRNLSETQPSSTIKAVLLGYGNLIPILRRSQIPNSLSTIELEELDPNVEEDFQDEYSEHQRDE